MIWTIDGSLARWRASTIQNRYQTTLGLTAALRAYFATPERHQWRPYIQAAGGLAYLANKWLGKQEQGAHVSLLINLGAGMEVGLPHSDKSLDFNWRLVHYSNSGVFEPNQGFDMLYVFSIGYLF